MNRRTFLSAACLPTLLRAAPPYDLVIRNGRVIDPSQHLDRITDVAIRDGKIAALGRNLHAAESIDVTGQIVVPGLIDIHLHARDAALPPSAILATGVTTMVDAGSRGADNIDQLIGIAKDAPNRMRILLNIGRLGNNPNGRGEFLDGIEPADVEKARAAVERNRAWIVGIKARLSRSVAADHDLEVLRRAQQVAAPLNIPVMIHIGDTASPLPQILALLRPGDIVTHMYAPKQGILDAQGRVLPEVRAARRRGVLFDFGNGRTEHWTWDVAQTALAQGFAPDTISSDLDLAGHTEQVFDLPTVLSKFLALGMPLPQVIACATSSAARVFREFKDLGSLRPNSPADVAVFELAQGNFDFVDNFKNKRVGSRKLIARTVIAGGRLTSHLVTEP
jgi:dihydroorotase